MIMLVRQFPWCLTYSEGSAHRSYLKHQMQSTSIILFVCLTSELPFLSLGTSPPYDFRGSKSFPQLKLKNFTPPYDFKRSDTFPRPTWALPNTHAQPRAGMSGRRDQKELSLALMVEQVQEGQVWGRGGSTESHPELAVALGQAVASVSLSLDGTGILMGIVVQCDFGHCFWLLIPESGSLTLKTI